MKKYFYFGKMSMQAEFTYSAWYWASLFSSTFMIMVQYFFWKAILGSSGVIGGMDLRQMITYYVLALAMGSFAPFSAGRTLGFAVYDGSIAIEFIRPYNLLLKAMATADGEIVTSFFGGFSVNYIIGLIFFKILFPVSWGAFGCFILSLLIGILIMQLVDLCIGIVAFWTSNFWGLRTLRFALFTLFSGQMLPLDLFPHWFQVLSNYLPFRQVVYMPIMIYTGHQPIDHTLITALLTQVMWVIISFIILQIMWFFAKRRVTVFGG